MQNKINLFLIVFLVLGSGFATHAMELSKEELGKKLISAAANGALNEVRWFLHCGADVNQRNNFAGCTALMLASLRGQKSTVEYLIKYAGADVNTQAFLGDTALSYAIWRKQTQIVKYLLEAGAKVNATVLDCAFIEEDRSYKSSSKMLEDAMLMPCREVKQCIYTFLNCLKKHDVLKENYSNLRNVFKPYLYRMIAEQNEAVLCEILKITNEEIQQSLLNAFYANKNNEKTCVIL